jgi:enterobactin synthetase component D
MTLGQRVNNVSEAFSIAWTRQVRFGALAAVPLPAGTEPVEASVLARLEPEERAFALSEHGRRQIEIVGGRLAARAAAGGSWPALLPGPEREPLPPARWSVSISHKNDLALALVGRAADGTLGIDLEGDARERIAIAERVCRPEEFAEVQALPETERWKNVLVRFAVKEAVYKAVYPHVRHFFGFQAARVNSAGEVTLFLPPEDPSVRLETELEWLSPQRVLAMVRAQR